MSDFSDVAVNCGEKTWNLHRIILSQRCQWFKRALLGGFKESSTSCINIEDWNEEQVSLVIAYIYRGPLEWKKMRGEETITTHCMNVFQVADYFLLEKLKEHTMQYFARWIFKATGVLQQKFEEQAPPNTEIFLGVVREIYLLEGLPASEAFRPIITMALHSVQHLLDKPTFAAFIDEVPTVAADLLKFHLTRRAKQQFSPGKCHKCGKFIRELSFGFSNVFHSTSTQRGGLTASCYLCE
ncbi:hypothetical protein NPX13_g11437 [Xylaria arbuscula]|uniref:BTB domain-containing protein n=1 Tax=Xylaria arbuscula TaxID=114810 RepID=A0A9W8TFK8_9PEZI|nr:hypothetical protein NPX13_g11437 [Xylaria arbuscula]